MTIKRLSASGGAVRDDNQKPDDDGGPEAASVGGLFHYCRRYRSRKQLLGRQRHQDGRADWPNGSAPR
jgi:hypothetical protein